MRERTRTADFEAQHPDQAPVTNERHDPNPKIDDLAFAELTAQLIEQSVVGRLMVASQHFGVANRGLLPRGENTASAVLRKLCDFLFV